MKIKESLEESESIKEIMDLRLKKLNTKWFNTHSYSKLKALSNDLISFGELYRICTEEYNMPWNNTRINDIFNDNYYKTMNKYFNNILLEKDIYNKISDNIINIFSQCKYPFYKDYGKNIKRINYKDMMEIIKSFLNNYDSKLYKQFEESLNNLEIFLINDELPYNGATYNINSLGKSYICLDASIPISVYFSKIVIHEIGHVFEQNLNRNNDARLRNYFYESYYYEVSSEFFEYAFLNYLKENKIYTEEADLMLDIHYKELFIHMASINLLTSLNEDALCEILENGNTISAFSDKIEQIENKANYYSFFEDDKLNLIDDFIYGVGELFSIYLYKYYKEDKEKFKKDFINVMCSYPYRNDILAFNDLKIDTDTLIKGKELRRVLTKK